MHSATTRIREAEYLFDCNEESVCKRFWRKS